MLMHNNNANRLKIRYVDLTLNILEAFFLVYIYLTLQCTIKFHGTGTNSVKRPQ